MRSRAAFSSVWTVNQSFPCPMLLQTFVKPLLGSLLSFLINNIISHTTQREREREREREIGKGKGDRR